MLKPIAAAFAVLLTSCAPTTTHRDAIDRVLAEEPRKAQPTEVIATELAMSRAAQEDGQWTALRDYAALAALLHVNWAPVEAALFLRDRPDPPASYRWTPEAVWMSCDSQIAVSQGKYVEAGGNSGHYATAWLRQRDGSYRWTYMLRAPDAALTERQKAGRPAEEDGTIIVQAVPMIRGETGDCLPGAPRPQPPVVRPAVGVKGETITSPDGTLMWTWIGSPPDLRRLAVLQAYQGRLTEVFTLTVADDGRVTADK